MAKTAAPKKKGQQSMHSRAAKRASSPSINMDKSLKNVKPPVETSNHRPSVLAIHQGAGVNKKAKNGRKSVLSTKAKRRHERGQDRAETLMDKIAKKIDVSRSKAKTVQERSKTWEELNRKVLAQELNDVIGLKNGQNHADGDKDETRVSSTQRVDIISAEDATPFATLKKNPIDQEDDEEIL